VQPRHAEDDHDGVTDVLLDGADERKTVTALIRVKNWRSTSRMSSGSRWEPIAVDPTTSAKSAVTVLRSSGTARV
jgi:hypothetical protein